MSCSNHNRAIASSNIVWKVLLVITVLAGGASAAQVGSGTIVILDSTKDKLVVAADSRLTFDDRPPEDTQCKIQVFGHRIVFTEMGAIAYTNSGTGWFNPLLARRAVREMGSLEKDPDTEIKDIASIWANSLAALWQSAYRRDREAVTRAIANSHNGPITGGVFAEARNGSIHWRFVAVAVLPNMDPPIRSITGEVHDCWPCGEGEKVCALARPEIPAEFCTQSSPRSKEEAAHWKPSPELAGKVSRETLHAIRLVDDTIAFDPHPGLGGKVDALELHSDGSINWVQRKPNCPEND